ncbi:MAG TPA: hypothetical protein VE153_13725 [Myxococcus sp.]|nr:hypothetical protein [Myxococcus sp.]
MMRSFLLTAVLLVGCKDRQLPPPTPELAQPVQARDAGPTQARDCDPEAPLPPCAPPGPDCRYEPDTAVCVQGEWRCGEIVCDTPGGG